MFQDVMASLMYGFIGYHCFEFYSCYKRLKYIRLRAFAGKYWLLLLRREGYQVIIFNQEILLLHSCVIFKVLGIV